jgi:hypothetical protein
MKKQQVILLALFFAVFAIPACDIDDDGPFWGDCKRGQGPEVEVALNMPEFTGVRLSSSVDVFITQGPNFEVIAKGEENIIDELELDVQNDVWDIEFDRCVRDFDLKLYITMPIIRSVSNSGSGNIRGENFFNVQDIVLRVSGSGDIDLGLVAEEIDGKISGSGDILLEGEAQNLDFDISGSGDLKAFNLVTQTADINISGSGDASVRVLEVLDARISGSGDIYFKGNPVINLNRTGSGNVVDAN